jgi:hypothetical protein
MGSRPQKPASSVRVLQDGRSVKASEWLNLCGAHSRNIKASSPSTGLPAATAPVTLDSSAPVPYRHSGQVPESRNARCGGRANGNPDRHEHSAIRCLPDWQLDCRAVTEAVTTTLRRVLFRSFLQVEPPKSLICWRNSRSHRVPRLGHASLRREEPRAHL